MKSALIIFVRNPVLGKVKTRIAKDLGDELALDVYKKLLVHTHSITKPLNIDRYVFYADYINNDDLWEDGEFRKQLQSGSDLGDRLHYAFQLLFDQGYNKVAVVGSDCYDLSTEIIEEAFKSLENHHTVVGPTLDGGYYLLGMNTFIPDVFKDKVWSTDSVFDDTLKSITALNYNYYLLPKLSDVDNADDCKAMGLIPPTS